MDSQQAHLQACQQQQQDQAAAQQLGFNQQLEWEAYLKARKEEESRANNVSSSTLNVPPGSGSSSYGTSYSSDRPSEDSFGKRFAENLNWLFQCWIVSLLVRCPFLVLGVFVAFEPELQLCSFILRITADFRSP